MTALFHRHRYPRQRADEHHERRESTAITGALLPLHCPPDCDTTDDEEQALLGHVEREADRGHDDPSLGARQRMEAARSVELPDRDEVEEVEKPSQLRDGEPDL